MLKKKYPNPSRKSKHYTKQSKFNGSNRQVRGLIIKNLTSNPLLTVNQLKKNIDCDSQTLESALQQLYNEQLIQKKGAKYAIFG